MSSNEGQAPVGSRGTGSLGTIYLLSALVGLISIAARVYLSLGTLANVIGWVMDAALLALIIVGVVKVTRSGGARVPLKVSLVGVVYGLVTGLGIILVPPSAAAVRAAVTQELKRFPSLSPTVVQQSVQRSMTLGSHITSAVSVIVVVWLLALLIAWIASLFVKRPGRSASV